LQHFLRQLRLNVSNGVTAKEWELLNILSNKMACECTYKNKYLILIYHTNKDCIRVISKWNL